MTTFTDIIDLGQTEFERQLDFAITQKVNLLDEVEVQWATDAMGASVWDRRCKTLAIAGFIAAVILKLPTDVLTNFALIVQPLLLATAYWVAHWE